MAEDAVTVAGAWEELLSQGRAAARVRLRAAPTRPVSLAFLDTRTVAGVVVCSLTPEPAQTDPDHGGLPSEVLRPRFAVVLKDLSSTLVSVDARTALMTGWTVEELVGRRSIELIHPEDAQRALRAWLVLRTSGDPVRIRVRHLCADGSWLWVELENHLITGADGNEVVHCDIVDVSEEMAAHDAVRRSARLFRLLAEAMPVGLLRLEADGSTGFANARVLEVLGMATAGDSLEQVLPDVTALLAAVATQDRSSLAAALHEVLRSTDERSPGPAAPGATSQRSVVEVQLVEQDGPRRWCRVECIPISDAEGTPGALVCISDTSEQHRAEQELRREATVDVLTGCANRAGTTLALEVALREAADARGGVGVVFVDLDGFKGINDSLGHAAGDQVLIEAGRRLLACVRAGDTVGRLGGDEFVVIVNDTGPALFERICDRLSADLDADVITAWGSVRLAASCGAVMAAAGEDAASVLGRADAEMYAAKRRRTTSPVVPGMPAQGWGESGRRQAAPIPGAGRPRSVTGVTAPPAARRWRDDVIGE